MNIPDSYYRVSVKALITDEKGRFMLCLDSSGKWELPGGGLDHGESVEQGLRREIKEEMGLEISEMAQRPIHFLTALDVEKNEWICNILFETKLNDLNFTPSDECLEFRFFNKQEALKERLFENVEKFIELYQ